jgi:hypothetical protein
MDIVERLNEMTDELLIRHVGQRDPKMLFLQISKGRYHFGFTCKAEEPPESIIGKIQIKASYSECLDVQNAPGTVLIDQPEQTTKPNKAPPKRILKRKKAT